MANAGISTYLRSQESDYASQRCVWLGSSESIQLSEQGNHRMECCYGLKRYTPRAVRWGIKGLASCSIASQNMRCVQLTGSCGVRSLAWKSYTAISRAQVLKYGLVSRKEKNSRSVVFCFPKGNEAAEVALRGRLATLRLAQLVEHFTINERVAGSIPVTYIYYGYVYKNAKPASVLY